jgi:hypothetical protein
LATVKITKRGRFEALRRYENAARSVEDFQGLSEMYDKLDANRERKERYWEKANFENLYILTDELKYNGGDIIPVPLNHPYWRELMRGNFISCIFDNAEEIWQIIGDWQIAFLVKKLTAKQKEVLFLRAVKFCTAEQIAHYTDKTDRAVRKLLEYALENIRSELAEKISVQIENGLSVTFAKRQFLEWYEQKKRDDTRNKKQENAL